jgi:hypothetical protein
MTLRANFDRVPCSNQNTIWLQSQLGRGECAAKSSRSNHKAAVPQARF